MYLPAGEDLRRFVLEQRTTAADLYFLKLVQYLGTDRAREAGWPQLLGLAQLVTDLDPAHGYAYEVAGIVLTDPVRRYDESNAILEKGIRQVPGRWQLPFFAAFNRWYGQQDYAGAAPLLLRAAQLPGSPAYLADLAARLFTEAGELETGLRLVDATLAQELPDHVRTDLEARRRDLLVERELRAVDAAAARFAARERRRPSGLEELVRAEGLKLPPFPVAYDHTLGEATSPLLEKRIRLHHADAKLAPLATD